MPTTWPDDVNGEDVGLFGGDESVEGYFDDDAEGYDDDAEATSADMRRRRARARRARELALRRARQRRMAPARPSYAPTTKTAVRQTQAAVQELDLRNKVQTDSFSGALVARDKRISGTEAGLAANAVQSQLQTSLGALLPDIANNPIVKVGLPIAPLLLLKPASRGRGLEGLARDPRVLGGALVAGLAIVEAIKGKSQDVSNLQIASVDELSVANRSTSVFSAVAVDGRGRIVPNKSVRWDTVTVNPAGAVAIDSDSGVVTATAEGSAIFSATVDDVVRTVSVTVGP